MNFYDHGKLASALNDLRLPPLTEAQEAAFETYAALLAETGKVMNLTAILDPEGIALLHFADSLSLLAYEAPEEGSRVCDVGSGAGFPMLPVSIVRPDLHVTVMDSTEKKVRFLQQVTDRLNLPVTCLSMRAEEAGRNESLRESFDRVTARAVSRLNKLAELCLPLVKVGGKFISMKGPSGREECEEARKGIGLLGGEVEEIRSFSLTGGEQRTLISVKKVRPTPTQYPRPYRKITSKPL